MWNSRDLIGFVCAEEPLLLFLSIVEIDWLCFRTYLFIDKKERVLNFHNFQPKEELIGSYSYSFSFHDLKNLPEKSKVFLSWAPMMPRYKGEQAASGEADLATPGALHSRVLRPGGTSYTACKSFIHCR